MICCLVEFNQASDPITSDGTNDYHRDENVNKPSQEDLLGYVLGAMDAQEQRDLQTHIDADPRLEDELLHVKNSLLPLEYLENGGPRPGLARRTCEIIAMAQREMPITNEIDTAQADGSLIDGCQRTSVSPTPLLQERLFDPSTWSYTNVLVGVASIAIFASVLFPAISYTRHHSRLVACQNNLQQLGQAFYQYSEMNNGRFVAIPGSGNLAVSGCFGPILKDSGLLADDTLLACQGLAQSRPPVRIPNCDQVAAASGETLVHLRRTMGGDFGYSMGYQERGEYLPPKNNGRTNVVLLSDAPSNDLVGRRSANHGGYGQNCLFEDGHVQFVSGHCVGGDAIFENDYGIVAPGASSNDSVIAASHLSPTKVLSTEY